MTEETPERIVLPRSGLVLQKAPDYGPVWARYGDESVAWMAVDSAGWSHGVFVNEGVDNEMPRDDMIRLLDTRVLSLRSALLSGAEETVTRAIGDAVGDDGAAVTHAEIARAVLAALCGEASK